MKHLHPTIRPKTVADIDRRVERVLEGLGNPEPPLDLAIVRDLLDLNLGFYRANDPGLIEKTVSRLKIAGKQVLARPGLLLDAVKKFDLKALYLPDRKRILINGDQPQLKHRWSEAHEIGHSLLPWHDGAMLGDTAHTLKPACHDQLESEANFAAGRLLFLRHRFDEECASYAPSFESLKALKPIYNNTYTTTFWRAVMIWGQTNPTVGLITGHPHPSKRDADFDPEKPVQHFIRSTSFYEAFRDTEARSVFHQVASYCRPSRAGPLGSAELVFTDDNGERRLFEFSSFSFHYQTLTLGVHRGLAPALVSAA